MRPQQYSFNENFLDLIDSPEKAYFLGWAYSDGCNMPKKKSYRLSLAEVDYEILPKLSQLVESSYPIHFKKAAKPTHQNQRCLYLYGEHFSQRLLALGVYPGKSKSMTISSEVPRHLLKYVLRGIFDGDGHISYTTDNRKGFKVVFQFTTGSLNFAEQLKEMVLELTGEKISSYTDGANFWVKFPSNRACFRFSKWLYSDRLDLSLLRKKLKILSFWSDYEEHYNNNDDRATKTIFSEEEKLFIKNSRAKGKTCKAISKIINKPHSSVMVFSRNTNEFNNLCLWKKYSCNDSYFDEKPLSDLKLFILGIFFSSGNLAENTNFKIKSRRLSKETLEFISLEISNTRPIKTNKDNISEINIATKAFSKKLISLGISINSKENSSPTFLSKDNIKAFLQGYFLSSSVCYIRKNRSVIFRIRGLNKELLKLFRQYIFDQTNILLKYKEGAHGSASFIYTNTKKEMINILDYLKEGVPLKGVIPQFRELTTRL